MPRGTGNEARGERRGFSIIELTVVIAILSVLVSLGYSALSRGRTTSKATACLSNLKQLAVGLDLYYNAHKRYPGDDLRVSLGPYLGGDSAVFLCPNDPDPQGDSYSRHYVCRTGQSTSDYVLACPLHVDESGAVTLFTSSSTQILEMRAVEWNGQQISPGAEVGSGVLTFRDGSRVTIPAGMVVQLVQSFRLRDGRLYSIIRVGVNETGTLEVQVSPGSRFEVITPAAIAGVQGTRFRVTTAICGPEYCATIAVAEGLVVAQDRWGGRTRTALRAGQSRHIRLHRARMRRFLFRRWELRRVRLPDDHLYETADGISSATATTTPTEGSATTGTPDTNR